MGRWVGWLVVAVTSALTPATGTAKPAKAPVPDLSAAIDAPAQRQLPPAVQQALRRVRVPLDAVSVVVEELQGVDADPATGRTLRWQADTPRNPASLAKLLTTAIALDDLGPAWRWRTPVWLDGPIVDGVLHGSLHLQGRGDPQLVLEQLWLLLQRVRDRGVREIRGDIVLDNRRFAPSSTAPGDFDGEHLRAYNVQPDALLLNQHAKVYRFFPDAAAGVARVAVQPPLAGAVVDTQVPLVATGPCGDWRRKLQADFGLPRPSPAAAGSAAPGADTPAATPEAEVRVRFSGSYPLACGELSWLVADPHPASYNARLLAGLWRDMGGVLAGQVRAGPPPAGEPSFHHASPALAEVVRDINKYSNNVMAQQLFLTLAAEAAEGFATAVPEGRNTPPAAVGVSAGTLPVPVSEDDARRHLQHRLQQRLGEDALAAGTLVVDNGSGLSRDARISARLLARLLTQVYDSPVMPEFMASLPIGGVDGTLRRSRATPGRAHLKTGSLRDVTGLAGYALSHSGRRYVLVALVNHTNAGAARPALDALVQWTLHDLPLR